MTERIRDFLRNRREDGPCLVVDLEVVRDNYAKFARALPNTRVFYAVKANPDPAVLKVIAAAQQKHPAPNGARVLRARIDMAVGGSVADGHIEHAVLAEDEIADGVGTRVGRDRVMQRAVDAANRSAGRSDVDVGDVGQRFLPGL